MSIENLSGKQEDSKIAEINGNIENPQDTIKEIMERGLKTTEGELNSLVSILENYAPEKAQKILNETFKEFAKILLNKQIILENPDEDIK